LEFIPSASGYPSPGCSSALPGSVWPDKTKLVTIGKYTVLSSFKASIVNKYLQRSKGKDCFLRIQVPFIFKVEKDLAALV
jgi:hypothetical protein